MWSAYINKIAKSGSPALGYDRLLRKIWSDVFFFFVHYVYLCVRRIVHCIISTSPDVKRERKKWKTFNPNRRRRFCSLLLRDIFPSHAQTNRWVDQKVSIIGSWSQKVLRLKKKIDFIKKYTQAQ